MRALGAAPTRVAAPGAARRGAATPALRLSGCALLPRRRTLIARAAAADPEEDETDDAAAPAQRGELSHETDVVIVGAGVSGCAPARAIIVLTR